MGRDAPACRASWAIDDMDKTDSIAPAISPIRISRSSGKIAGSIPIFIEYPVASGNNVGGGGNL
jgi:hypothetical protein